ncbi:COG4223 family protein [Paracoccus xiamenensis]|uniref:COG4223 family protein n=1 Tax=Paracoccus xiamenensis TaxID=2714901 RepID=UPI00140AA435|nr:hypothetical protein [Paracoccus xiamenensis]NHF73729.1 hypothetical protein [Paracoccus xiamenensis]
MATSDKADKASKAKSTGKAPASGAKRASEGPVVPSTSVSAGDEVTVSRIPPSQPIESTLLGDGQNGRPAAGRKSTAEPLKLTQSAKPEAAKPAGAGAPEAAKPETPKPAVRQAARPDPEPASQPVVKKVGFWPLAFGGVVAAALGAGAAIYAMPQLAPYLPASWQAPTAQPPQVDFEALRSEAVAAATDAARAEVASAMENMQGEAADDAQMRAAIDEQIQAALSAAPPPAPAQPASAASTAAPSADVTARIAALQTQLEAQAGQIAELTARPQLDAAAMQQVQELAQGASAVKAEIDAAAAAARDSLAAVQEETQAATQRAQAVASVAVLGAALEGGGASPTEAVQQLEQSGVAVPEPLAQQDLPTLDQLQMSFDAPARAALTASLKAESQSQGPLGAVSNFLRVQTGARSVEPREGTDPDAVLSRASALVEQGDLPTALEELKALPEAGQAAMADWVAQANAYLSAQSALSDVAKSLN